ncbi:MAG: HlyD family efflux transporter periplasmic adaptor subunit [Calothrix sp. FI2-JRJ7]|jgi:multidrug resistance efflux pump|nr:HlyD family efflux transporter periplasmic adaptor subunit [Calothrix sp. FI2-JRJ7]
MQGFQGQKVTRSLVPRSLVSNIAVLAVGIGLFAWSFNLIKTKFTSVVSRDAVINGVLIDVKTPSEGVVTQLSPDTGNAVSKSQVIAVLKNERVSQLQIEQITTKLKQQQSELKNARVTLNALLALMGTVKQDKVNQVRLENQQSQQSIQQVESDLQAALSRYRLAEVNYNRTKLLATQGALPMANLDTATLEMQERAAQVKSLQASLLESRTRSNAASLSLSLDKTRSNYDPSIRQQELQLQITNQQNQVRMLEEGIASTSSELKQANLDLQRQKSVIVKVPTGGVIWKMNAQNGKLLEKGESVGQVLDCSRRWIDVFVDEQSLSELQPGTPATVELYGAQKNSYSQTLHGKISLVRSGVGRLTAGEEVAIPINANLARNTQVRVELNANTKKENSKFCYVGYTGKVTFQING